MTTRMAIPALLVATSTIVLIDAVSVLWLGRVFTANMTGNAVFLGFALAAVAMGGELLHPAFDRS